MQTSAVLSPRLKNVNSCSCSMSILTKRVSGNVQAQARVELIIHAARFLDQIDAAGDVAFLRGVELGDVFGDQVVLVGLENRLIEGHPAERRASLDDLVEIPMFAFAERDGFLRAQIVAHYFGEQLPPAADFRRQPLANDVAQRGGQTKAQLLFFAERKETEDAVDRLASISSMQCAQNQMASFRCHQSDFDRGAVAHLTAERNF